MGIQDTLAKVPTPLWLAGGVGVIGAAVLLTRGSSTVSSGGQTSPLTDALGGLQNALNGLPSGSGATTGTTGAGGAGGGGDSSGAGASSGDGSATGGTGSGTSSGNNNPGSNSGGSSSGGTSGGSGSGSGSGSGTTPKPKPNPITGPGGVAVDPHTHKPPLPRPGGKILPKPPIHPALQRPVHTITKIIKRPVIAKSAVASIKKIYRPTSFAGGTAPVPSLTKKVVALPHSPAPVVPRIGTKAV